MSDRLMREVERIAREQQRRWALCVECGAPIRKSVTEALPCLFCGEPVCLRCYETDRHQCEAAATFRDW